MDLIATLKNKIAILEDGEYILGLNAVLLHIETAFRHLLRGQNDGDETAFTDAIYRTNQAFEGSLKELYRVITEKDPNKRTPFEIEKYLIDNRTFRDRVLTQLKNYRTDWRNPSAHDYKLDFDLSEAFLAISSVSAFACVLLDQIAEELAYKRSKAETETNINNQSLAVTTTDDARILPLITELLKAFCESSVYITFTQPNKRNEFQLLGALHGFLAKAAPNFKFEIDHQFKEDPHLRADLLVSCGNEQLLIEVKNQALSNNYVPGVLQLERLLQAGKVKEGILLLAPDSRCNMEEVRIHRSAREGSIVVIKPADL